MFLYKRKDSPNWYVAFTENGRKRCRPLHLFLGLQFPVTSRAKAKKLLARLETKEFDVQMGLAQDVKAVAVEDLYHQYLQFCEQNRTRETARANRYRIGVWVLFLKLKGIAFTSQITKQLLKEFVDDYLVEIRLHVTNSTKNRYLNLVHASLRWAVEQGIIESNPVAGIIRRSESHSDRLMDFRREEIEKLFAIEDQDFGNYLRVMYYTMMRRREVLALTWEDLDFRKRLIRIRAAKSQKAEWIEMAEALVPILRSLPQGGDQLFPFTADYVTRKFQRLRKRLQLRDIRRIHDIRHAGISRLAEANVDIKTIQALARHRDVKTTLRYIHSSTEARRKAINVL